MLTIKLFLPNEYCHVTFLDQPHPDEPDYDYKWFIVENGYYVSNDKHMHKHLKGGLVDRNWCSSRRIGFHIDKEVG